MGNAGCISSTVRHGAPKGPGRGLKIEVLQFRALFQSLGLGSVNWRFIGSYKWGYRSPNVGYNNSYPT